MLLVDERGAPLSIIVIGANRHDMTQLATTLDSIVVERPEVRPYPPRVRSRGEEKVRKKNRYNKPRRWNVEVAHSWFNRLRKVLVRNKKTDRSYLTLNMLAAAIICFRKVPGEINITYG